MTGEMALAILRKILGDDEQYVSVGAGGPAGDVYWVTLDGQWPLTREEYEALAALEDEALGRPGAEIFIQWKGTDVCLDFHCSCQPVDAAYEAHFDGDFAYTLMCPACGTVYEMPTTFTLRPGSRTDIAPKVPTPDHDDGTPAPSDEGGGA